MKTETIIAERLVYGMLEEDEIRALAQAIIAFTWGPDDIAVEVGVWKGWTTVMMGKLLVGLGLPCPVIGIDAFERVRPDKASGNPAGGSYQLAMQQIMAAGLGRQVIVISADSSVAARIIPPRVGALVIDGWHSYEQTKADLMDYVPKLLPGGFCLVDDYCDFYPGVIKAVDWFLANYGEVTLEKKLNKGLILRRI